MARGTTTRIYRPGQPIAIFAGMLMLTLNPAAEAKPSVNGRPDFTGIWTSIDRQPDATHVNTSFPTSADRAHFTAAGLAASRDWAEHPERYPGGRCLPGRGPFTLLMTEPFFPMEIIQKPKQLTIISEYLSVVGRVYLDGRKHPDDLDNSWLGHSIGHWDGRVLVVDTVAPKEGIINGSGRAVTPQKGDDAIRLPFDEAAHIVSRFTLLAKGKYIREDLTITDPTFYTQPLKITHYWLRAPVDWEIKEYFCNENQRSADEGFAGRPKTPQ